MRVVQQGQLDIFLHSGADDCDFEDGTCHWKVASVDYLWSIQQGETPTEKTGPSHDHSYSKSR